jgi:hypothetical protein
MTTFGGERAEFVFDPGRGVDGCVVAPDRTWALVRLVADDDPGASYG